MSFTTQALWSGAQSYRPLAADTLGGLVLNEALSHRRHARYRDRFTMKREDDYRDHYWHDFAIATSRRTAIDHPYVCVRGRLEPSRLTSEVTIPLLVSVQFNDVESLAVAWMYFPNRAKVLICTSGQEIRHVRKVIVLEVFAGSFHPCNDESNSEQEVSYLQWQLNFLTFNRS